MYTPLSILTTGYNDASCDLPLVVCLTQVIKSNQLSTDASDVWQTIYDLRTCPLTLPPPPSQGGPCTIPSPLLPFRLAGRSQVQVRRLLAPYLLCNHNNNILYAVAATDSIHERCPSVLQAASCKLQLNEFIFLFGMFTICLLILHLELCIIRAAHSTESDYIL